jgi:hypothetical protein
VVYDGEWFNGWWFESVDFELMWKNEGGLWC